MILRLSLSDTEYFDAEVKPFDELTVAEYITLAEEQANYGDITDLQVAMMTIHKFTGCPLAYIYCQSPETVARILGAIHDQVFGRDDVMGRLNKVHEALAKWEEDHDGNSFTKEDARRLMEEASLFCDRIEVDGRVFTAPDPETAPFGKWLDLQGAMKKHEANDGLESEAYVAALSAMMVGADGPFPVQGTLSDAEYSEKVDAYTSARREVFMRARWVEVMGCAAFFFSKSQLFAGYTSAYMSRFRNLLQPKSRPVLRIITSAGASTSN